MKVDQSISRVKNSLFFVENISTVVGITDDIHIPVVKAVDADFNFAISLEIHFFYLPFLSILQ